MDDRTTLQRYLQQQRDALLRKLDGLDERQARMPRTATGTSLLGIVKHVASVEAGYLGETFGRPWPEPTPWDDDDAELDADMWATVDESVAEIVERYRRVQAHGDATIAALPLDAVGRVPWWGDDAETTLHRVLVHLVAEVARHVGQMDILRESVDGAVGLRSGASNLPDVDERGWREHVERLRAIAEAAG